MGVIGWGGVTLPATCFGIIVADCIVLVPLPFWIV